VTKFRHTLGGFPFLDWQSWNPSIVREALKITQRLSSALFPHPGPTVPKRLLHPTLHTPFHVIHLKPQSNHYVLGRRNRSCRIFNNRPTLLNYFSLPLAFSYPIPLPTCCSLCNPQEKSPNKKKEFENSSPISNPAGELLEQSEIYR
jgi:hypothetical protein